MNFDDICDFFPSEHTDVEVSTMMGSKCLRYKGAFIGMYFNKADALIIKVSADRVNELLDSGHGLEFNYTKKRFKEWVLIPSEDEDEFESYMLEAMQFAQTTAK